MTDEHLLVERPNARRAEDPDERAAKRAAEALAERLQREVELFLRGRGADRPDA
jgi:hypothetical protein